MNNIWIALAHVKTRHGFENILGYRHRAYVNIIGKARNTEELKNIAKKTFFNEGFILIEELKDIELLSDRLERTTVNQEILDLINNINETYPVQFDVFQTYPEEDEIED